MSQPIYSILQLGLLAFFGGPFAAIYSLKKNFDVLENEKASMIMIICGALCALIFPIIVLYWPDTVPKIVIPAVFTLVSCSVAFIYQFKNWDKGDYLSKGIKNMVLVVLGSWTLAFTCFFLSFLALHLMGVDIGQSK